MINLKCIEFLEEINFVNFVFKINFQLKQDKSIVALIVNRWHIESYFQNTVKFFFEIAKVVRNNKILIKYSWLIIY